MLQIENVQVFNLDKTSYPDQIVVVFDIKSSTLFNETWQLLEKDIVMSQSSVHSLKKFLSTPDFDPFNKHVTEKTRSIVKRLFQDWEKAKEQNDKVEEYKAYQRLANSIPYGLELWATVSTTYEKLTKFVCNNRYNSDYGSEYIKFVDFCFSLPRF